jgi:hypothetical protein
MEPSSYSDAIIEMTLKAMKTVGRQVNGIAQGRTEITRLAVSGHIREMRKINIASMTPMQPGITTNGSKTQKISKRYSRVEIREPSISESRKTHRDSGVEKIRLS